MKICIIYLGTTGLDERCPIIEIACTIEDTNNVQPLRDLPTFQMLANPAFKCENAQNPDYMIERWTKENNMKLLRAAIDSPNTLLESMYQLSMFVLSNNAFTKTSRGMQYMWGGANAQFDYERLCKAFNRIRKVSRQYDKLHIIYQFLSNVNTRFIDPANMLTDFKRDLRPPSLAECLLRCGIETEVQHRAVADVYCVARCLRRVTNDYEKTFF